MKSPILFLFFSLLFTNNLLAQEYNLAKFYEVDGSIRYIQKNNPQDYKELALDVANYIYDAPLGSIEPKNHNTLRSFLSIWTYKTEEYWFNFKKPAGAYSITENKDNLALYLACNVKYCLENPNQGGAGDEENTNYRAFLLFIDYYESDKVNDIQRKHKDIQNLIKAKNENGLLEHVNGRGYIHKKE
jgi:hypothetical protein